MKKQIVPCTEIDYKLLPRPNLVQVTMPKKFMEAPYFYNDEAWFVQFNKVFLSREFTFDPENPSIRVELVGQNGKEVESVYSTLHEKTLDWVVEWSSEGKLGSMGKNIKTREGAAVTVANPIFYRRDSNPPMKYFNIRTYKDKNTGKLVVSTVFKIPNPSGHPPFRTVPVEFLEGRLFEFIPIVHMRRIYVGAKISNQSALDTVIITDFLETVTSKVEERIAEKLRAEDAKKYERMMGEFSSWKTGGPTPAKIAAVDEPDDGGWGEDLMKLPPPVR